MMQLTCTINFLAQGYSAAESNFSLAGEASIWKKVCLWLMHMVSSAAAELAGPSYAGLLRSNSPLSLIGPFKSPVPMPWALTQDSANWLGNKSAISGTRVGYSSLGTLRYFIVLLLHHMIDFRWQSRRHHKVIESNGRFSFQLECSTARTGQVEDKERRKG